jgi:hypothetical protein
MHPQLAAVDGEFLAATERLHRLRKAVPESEWPLRRNPDQWSVAECVTHLNLTASAYIPILTDAIVVARRNGGEAPARLRRDPVGWLLWLSMPPPVRHRMKTIPRFIPESNLPVNQMVAEFEDLQDQLSGMLRAADGFPINRIRVASPFNAKMTYNLYSCFTILSAHQHRHLWQAEQLWPEHFR